MDKITDRINYYFKESNLTKKEFGKQVGVSEVTIHNILNGNQSIKVETLQKIAEVLKIEITHFFHSDGQDNALEESERIEELKRLMWMTKTNLIRIINNFLTNHDLDIDKWVTVVSLVEELVSAAVLERNEIYEIESILYRTIQHMGFKDKRFRNLMDSYHDIQSWIYKNLVKTGKSKSTPSIDIFKKNDLLQNKLALQKAEQYDMSLVPDKLINNYEKASMEFSAWLRHSIEILSGKNKAFSLLFSMDLLEETLHVDEDQLRYVFFKVLDS